MHGKISSFVLQLIILRAYLHGLEDKHFGMKRIARSFLLRYTVLFSAFFVLVYASLILVGKSFLWSVDGLEITYPCFVYEGSWLRGIVKNLFTKGVLEIPLWDTSIGLGSDIILTIGTNPFNLLAAFFPARYAEYGMTFVIVLEMYSAGLAFSLFARGHGIKGFPEYTGAMTYVFCGWMVTAALRQHLFIMPMVFFPLILAGIDRVFERRSPTLFVVSFALMFIGYFYFAYMTCIALLIYCVYKYVNDVPIKSIVSFVSWVSWIVFLGIIGVLISCAVLLPFVNSVLGQGRLQLEHIVPILYPPAYYGTFPAKFIAIGNVGMDAFLGFGGVAFLACVLLFSQRGRLPLKVIFACSTAMMLIPYFGHLFNGFSYVTNRWAWIYSLCIAYIIAEMILPLLRANAKERIVLAVSVACLALWITVLPDGRNAASYGCCLLAALFVILVFVVNGNADQKRIGRRGGKYAAMFLVAVSMAFPAFYWIADFGSNWAKSEVDVGKAYGSHFEDKSGMMKKLGQNDLWRYDLYGVARTRNNSMLRSLNSFDYYTPIYNENLDSFLEGLELGSMRYSHFLTDLDRRSYIDAILGAKYFLINAGGKDYLPYGYETIASEKKVGNANYIAYESGLALPLAFFSSSIVSSGYYEVLNSVEKQQLLCQAVVVDNCNLVSNSENTLKMSAKSIPYTITSKSSGMEIQDGSIITTKPNSTLTIDFEAPAEVETYVRLGDVHYQPSSKAMSGIKSLAELLSRLTDWYRQGTPTSFYIAVDTQNGRHMNLGFLTPANHMYAAKNSALVNLGYNEVSVSQAKLTFVSPGTYSLDEIEVIVQPMDILRDGVSKLRDTKVDFIESTNRYAAHVSAHEAGVMCATIPWSQGWSATVDGEPAQILKTDTAFIGVELSRGDHEVVFTYKTPLLIEGLLCSIMGLVLLTIVQCVFLARKRKEASVL